MFRRSLWLVPAVLLVGAFFGGCNCGGPGPGGEDAGDDAGVEVGGKDGGTSTDGGSGGGGKDGGTTDGGSGQACLDTGTACGAAGAKPCCSSVCQNGTCTAPTFCKDPGAACAGGTECCSNQCLGGKCSTQQCLDVGQSCGGDGECCTFTCTGGKCANVPGGGSCRVLGQACSVPGDCCSTNCQGGACVRAYSCNAYNDVCLKGSDCCSNVCSGTNGKAGYCVTTTGATGCTQSGNPCSSGNNCCTRVCGDQGTGATVCQPVGGCRVAGDFCSSDTACCGGAPAGPVQCVASSERCDNGQACRAPGTICGKPTRLLPDGGYDWVRLPDGGQFTVNNETNCCDGNKPPGTGGMEVTCKVDRAGVPRCFGGGSVDGGSCATGYTGQPGCCIAEANPCQFRDQCCNGELCVPGTDGGLQCARSTCAPVGASCNSGGADCCAGTQCRPAGELLFACQVVQPPADGGSGTPADAGTACRLNGQSCASAAGCCSGICTTGTCQAPATCQPQSAACTTSGDCCAGLTCNVPGGATSGTCGTGSTTCSGLSQACSATAACCSGLSCLAATGFQCDGSSACSCSVIIR